MVGRTFISSIQLSKSARLRMGIRKISAGLLRSIFSGNGQYIRNER